MNYLEVLRVLLDELQFRGVIDSIDWSCGEGIDKLDIFTKNNEVISVEYDTEKVTNIEYILLEKQRGCDFIYMVYNFNGKNIKISDDEIKNNMKFLELTQEEAIQIWLEDNGYMENAEVQELTAKAKASGADKIKADRKPRAKVERVPKENPIKEQVIKKIAEMLKNEGFVNIKIENKTKIVTFMEENRHFTVNLIENRVKKS